MGQTPLLDPMRHVITLEDGSTYKVARGVNVKRIKAGEKVTVTTSKFGGPSRPLRSRRRVIDLPDWRVRLPS
jgi:Protein of unknown function (DUF1344)